jgi:hypothetical protein
MLFAICLSHARGQGAVIMQDKVFHFQHTQDSSLMRQISLESAYNRMSDIEKESVYWINYLRKHPDLFRTCLLQPFLSQFPEMQSSAARSLDRELSTEVPMSILLPATNLNKAASLQAEYLVESHQFTHTGPKGRPFKVRMEDVGVRECAGENLFEGKADPLVSLMLLLIDQGVAGYGHRKALLNSAFSKVGVGAVVDANGTMMMVQVFSCQ